MSRRTLSALALSFIASFVGGAVGCAADASEHADSDSTDSSDEQIVGGSKPLAAETAITASVLDPTNADVGQFCTGIVVDRDVVLTAAHCFEDRTRVPYVRVGSKSNKAIRVQQIAIHGQYDETRRKNYDSVIEKATSASTIKLPTGPLYDLALLYLESPLPASAKVATFAQPDLASSTLDSVGFGCTSTACTAATDTLHKVRMTYVKQSNAARLLVLNGGKKKGTCFGDSGGPDVVVSGTTVAVFGMVSTGPESCEAGISVDTMLAPYLTWIDQTKNALHEGRTSSGFVAIEE